MGDCWWWFHRIIWEVSYIWCIFRIRMDFRSNTREGWKFVDCESHSRMWCLLWRSIFLVVCCWHFVYWCFTDDSQGWGLLWLVVCCGISGNLWVWYLWKWCFLCCCWWIGISSWLFLLCFHFFILSFVGFVIRLFLSV